MPAEPAEGAGAIAAGPRYRARLRLASALLGGVFALAALLVIGRELIAARVPEHRAALEELIRHETGLEITFTRLSMRWGWYGPEAVFHEVVLGEPEAAALLRAGQLVVGVDAWRSVRSGHLEAGRIRLINPDIDLGSRGAAPPGKSATPAYALADAPRLLARWRGGRIQIEGGSVRWASAAGGAPVTVSLRHADLRRLGAQWSAEAQLLLPDSLGVSARLGLRLSGDPARPQTLQGTMTFSGERLAFAGWRTLGIAPRLARLVPRAGSGDLDLQATIADGVAVKLAGSLHAQSLEWEPRGAPPVPLVLTQLRADWQLTRTTPGWRLAVGALDVGGGATRGGGLLVLAEHTSSGTLHEIPLPAFAALAHWYAPQLPLEDLALGGEASTLSFDWDEQRPAGTRLQAAADVHGLTLASAAQDVRLSGLSARLHATDTSVTADLDAPAGRLFIAREQPVTFEGLELSASIAGQLDGARWRFSSDDLQIRQGAAHFGATLALATAAEQAPRQLDAHVQIRDADVLMLTALVGPRTLAALGPAASRITAGHLTSGEFELHGPLAAPAELAAGSHGAFELRDAQLAGTDTWPAVQDLAARIDWRGTRLRANVSGARSGDLTLVGAHAEWDARGEQPLRATARLSGGAAQALAWLRVQPQLTAAAPLAGSLDLDGDTLLDVDLVVPGSGAHQPAPRTRITAALQGVRLHPLAGIPALEALHGILAFSAGHLQRSTLVGRWLGGPVTLAVAERHEGDATALTLSGRGLLDVREALAAAGGDADPQAPLSGNTEWSAQLIVLPADAAAQVKWRLRADSGLAGVVSGLPEPLGKTVNATLPLHLELQGQGTGAQLRLSLADRLQGIAALERSGDRWRIGRGVLRFAAGAPLLPDAALLSVEGRVAHLDLAAYVALWRQAGAAATLPALEAHLNANELITGTRSYRDTALVAHGGPHGGEIALQSAQLAASLSWPAIVDAVHPARVHLVSFEAADASDAGLGAGLTALLGPAVELGVDDLSWRGRSLGSLAAAVAAQPGGGRSTDLRLGGAQQELRAHLQCVPGRSCAARFSMVSTDAQETLAAYGFRADIGAQHAQLEGELEWPQDSATPLATLNGHLHMQLDEGVTRTAAAPPDTQPFALLLVPALLRGLGAATAEAGRTEPAATDLRFARLSGDFELRDGIASTANLHLDGDAEIWVRASVGLMTHDYDGEALILRGEERLPSPVRRLGPTPKVAALWLSLRGWLTGSGAENARAALRLRGTWNDPIVMSAQ